MSFLRAFCILSMTVSMAGPALCGPRTSDGKLTLEVDKIDRKPSRIGALHADKNGDIIDPDCYLTTDDIANYVRQDKLSGSFSASAIYRHEAMCEKIQAQRRTKLFENNLSQNYVNDIIAQAKALDKQRSDCRYRGYYINVSGNQVRSPRCFIELGARYQCNDGYYSFAENPQGACSYHGGVYQSFQ